jgi:hypothetical protein
MAKRPALMRPFPSGAVLLIVSALAGCHRDEPQPQPTGATSEAATAVPTLSPSTAPAGPTGAALDTGAIHDRTSPDRVLRFYVAALEQGQWNLAATAWRSSAGVTGATLKDSYDRGAPLRLEIGKGDEEGAAGSSFYDVPVTLRFGQGKPETGTLTLRRVNDVPGATPEQLDWRIERSTIGASQ